MIPKYIEKKILSYSWERWSKRPLGAFMLSLFNKSIKRDFMKKTGINTEYRAVIFQNGVWYKSDDVTIPFRKDIEKFLENKGTIFDVVSSCEKSWKKGKMLITKMSENSKENIFEKLARFRDIISEMNAYVWLTYGFEEIYNDRLLKEIPKFIDGNPENIISKLSVPSKLTEHMKFERFLRSQKELKWIQENFGWIKSRDGFARAFSVSELRTARTKLRNELKNKYLKKNVVPKEIQQLVKEFQALVYLHTLRGDARSNLVFLMRPILKNVALQYKISFNDLRNYSICDLINGTPKRYEPESSFLFYKGQMSNYKRLIIKEEKIFSQNIRGKGVFPGIVKGHVKIVTHVEDLKKIQSGDILVTQMTFPAFIIALRKACAFITDEGGITCHAAVMAREMKKPCVIGTKIVTRVLRDGDLVEVDAYNGVVKKIK